ncbi:MAG: ComF family protein [Arenicella sp.]
MNLLQQGLNALIPLRCQLCLSHITCHTFRDISPNEANKLICTFCEITLPKIDLNCSKCSTPLKHDSNTELCGTCVSQERHWQRCIAPFSYEEPITQLIHQFKYQNNQTLKTYFAHTIINTVKEIDHIKHNSLITHVPMHPQRFFERGYNQSLILALSISALTNIPHKNLLIKTHTTPHQVSLSKKDREIQLKNSFNIQSNQEYSIENKYIILIDDVVTTGATSTEIAKTLKRFGAKEVDIWCIART